MRLVEGRDLDALAQLLTATGRELASWIGQTLVQWFSDDADQRYTLMRVRRLSSALDAKSVDEHVLSIVAALGQAVLDGLL